MSYDQGYQNQQQPYQQQVVYQQAQQYPYTQSSSLIQPQAVTVVQPGADTKKENDMALLLLVIGCFFPIVCLIILKFYLLLNSGMARSFLHDKKPKSRSQKMGKRFLHILCAITSTFNCSNRSSNYHRCSIRSKLGSLDNICSN